MKSTNTTMLLWHISMAHDCICCSKLSVKSRKVIAVTVLFVIYFMHGYSTSIQELFLNPRFSQKFKLF
jgi:hypothetical protein